MGLHQARVAGLARGIEAPVVEFRHHLVGCNAFVKAAIGDGASICRIVFHQIGKAGFGGFPGQPLVVERLGLFLGGGQLLLE